MAVEKLKERRSFKKIKEKEVTELTLKQILSHGKEGAVNGTIKMEKTCFFKLLFFQREKRCQNKINNILYH